jgi:hypothetical protein
MTDVDGDPGSVLDPESELPLASRLCPYLLADAGWRVPTPSGDHRCTAVRPAARLAGEKQARLCLTVEHRACATFTAAVQARAARGLGPTPTRRPIARTAPIVVERSRPLLPGGGAVGSTRWGQAGLIALMIVALLAVVFARTSGPEVGGGGTAASPSASVPASGSTQPSVAAESPSPAQSGPGSVGATPTLPLESVAATYTVRKGDTLSGVAARFGTTVAALKKANRLSSTTLKVGQVLTIP